MNQTTTKATFTPGPWSSECVPTQIGHAHKIQPIGACLYVDHRDKRELDEKTVTAAANATLIAAAPDLYAACKAWLSYFDRLARDDEPGDPLSALRNSFHATRVQQTRDALAKAEAV